MRWVGGAEKQQSQDPHTRMGDPQTGGQSKLQSFFERSERSKPYAGLLSPWVLHQGGKCPERLTLRAGRACIWESQKATQTPLSKGFPGGSDHKESARNVGDQSLIPGLGRSPGEENGNPGQQFCLENPMDRGAQWLLIQSMGSQRVGCD